MLSRFFISIITMITVFGILIFMFNKWNPYYYIETRKTNLEPEPKPESESDTKQGKPRIDIEPKKPIPKFNINDLVWYENMYGTRTFFYVDEILEGEDGFIYIARWLRDLDNAIVEHVPERILHKDGSMPLVDCPISMGVSNSEIVPDRRIKKGYIDYLK